MEVVMYPSSLDERGLVGTDEGVHERRESQCQPLGDQFTKVVDETNWSVIPEDSQGIILAQQYHGSIIEAIEEVKTHPVM